MTEISSAVCTANRVLKLLRRPATGDVGAPEGLLEDLKNSISEISDLLHGAEIKKKIVTLGAGESAGIRSRLDRLQDVISIECGEFLPAEMKGMKSDIRASLDTAGAHLRNVLLASNDGIGDSLQGLGEAVRDAREKVARGETLTRSLDALVGRQDSNKNYSRFSLDCQIRFDVVFGEAKNLLDGIESTIATFSPPLDGIRIRQALRDAGSHLLVEKPRDAFEIRSWLWRVGEALGDAENLLESATFGIGSGHGGGGACHWYVNINNNINNNCLGSSSTTATDPGREDLWQALQGICATIGEAVVWFGDLPKGQGRLFGLMKDTTRGESRDEIQELGDLAKELAWLGFCFKRFPATRDRYRNKILELMFRESRDKVRVIQMVERGIAKTALARDVFEDASVKTYFGVRIWMTIDCDDGDGDDDEGESFSHKKVRELTVVSSDSLAEKINISTTEAVKLVYDSIVGKRYLLVLDDISRHFSHNLDYLYFLLMHKESCAPQSRILVSSDNGGQLELSMGFVEKVQLYNSQVECWSLFKMSALGGRDPKGFQERIGKEISKSFQSQQLSDGELLAMGGVFRFAKLEAEWLSLYKDELIPMIKDQQGNYSRFLKFAYDQLPFNLMQCFAYCSLFPTGYEFDVQTVIKLWMAQGFIESSSPSHSDKLEDVGYMYFLNLLQRFFFDEVKVDGRGRASKCRVHYVMDQLKYCIDEGVSHLISDTFTSTVPSRAKTRSILFPGRVRCEDLPDPEHGHWDKLFSDLRFLRALDMHNFSIKEVPDSIGNLKHLRYLDLSENDNLEKLPDSITRLLNLQTLKLSHCSRLKELPPSLKNLVNLRHLEIDGCNSLTSLPREFGKLTNLRTLSQIVLSDDASKSIVEIEDLKQLRQLRELRIKNLRHGMHQCLENMLKLRFVSIEWESRAPTFESLEMPGEWKEFSDLEEWSMNGCYFIKSMTSFTRSLKNLRKLHLKRCMRCKILPRLDQCDHLRILILDEMLDLEYISDGWSNQVCDSLLEVWLTELPKLKRWSDDSPREIESGPLLTFSRLSKLVIEDCPNLVSMPLFPTLEEGLVLDSTSWKPFQQTMEQSGGEASSSSSSSAPLSKLKNLCIVAIDSFDISEANKIKWETLQNLKMLKLDFVPKLDSLPEGLQHVITLRELHIWRCGVKEIPTWIDKLQVLERLVLRVCPKLETLPEEIKNVKSLKTLEIEDCQTLLRRCEKGIGADWYKISHVPERRFGRISRKAG